jgi:hypothetical protein
MTRLPRGSTLVMNLFIMAIFALMAAIVYKSAKTTVLETVYYERSAQALSIAEAGMEDALHSLYSTATWRTGFAAKPFADGYYTVTVTSVSATSLFVVSSGYSTPSLLTGRAVKTVSATVVFISSANPTNAVMSNNLTVNGTVDPYDPRVSLTPTIFTDGGTVWADSIRPTSNCASPRIFTNVIYLNSNSAPGAGCVNSPPDVVNSTPTPVSLPTHPCANPSPCYTAALQNNLNINAQNPATSPYTNPGGNNPTLNVTQDQVVTLSSGTYYFKSISVDKGILNVDTTLAPVTIYYLNSFTMTDNAAHPCEVNNLSKIPSNLLIVDVGGSHTVTLQCTSVPLYAYLEGSANQFNVNSGQVVFGHFSGGTTSIASGAKLHFDLSAGVPATLVTWTTGPSGSWTESYKRQ